jgi:hypothetical protein
MGAAKPMQGIALLLTALPAASAIALANFQRFSWSNTPTCEVPYNAQIPSCSPSDFYSGCSTMCRMALETVALRVIHACSQAPVPANSLLSAVLEGGVVQGVCPPNGAYEFGLSKLISRGRVR